jgi:hypothetical protein
MSSAEEREREKCKEKQSSYLESPLRSMEERKRRWRVMVEL